MESIQFFFFCHSLHLSLWLFFFFLCCSALILWIGSSTDFTFSNFSILFFFRDDCRHRRRAHKYLSIQHRNMVYNDSYNANTFNIIYTTWARSSGMGQQVFFLFYFIFSCMCARFMPEPKRNFNNVCALSWFIDLTLVYCHFIFTIEWAK